MRTCFERCLKKNGMSLFSARSGLTGIFLLSMISAAFACPQADLTGDCVVDLDDLAVFADQWLDPAGCAEHPAHCADFVGNDGVNQKDFAVYAKEWLQSGSPVVINEIHYNPDMPTELVEFVELHNISSQDVDLSGWYFCDGVVYTFPPGTTISANGYVVVAEDSTLAVSPTTITGKYGTSSSIVYGPFMGHLNNDGERIQLCDADGFEMDQVYYQLGFPWPTVGDEVPEGAYGNGHSIQLVHSDLDNDLGGSWRSAYPTPGTANTMVYATNVPPHIRQVVHTPNAPVSSQVVTITAKVTDTDGVASVTLAYQIVLPGDYIPINFPDLSSNPTYESAANWISVAMHDDGLNGDAFARDSVYTVEMPPTLQVHRRLIRYRITVEDTAANNVTVPYNDDPQPNFAYFVYDGVPAWSGAIDPDGPIPGTGEVVTYGTDIMQSLPVYHLITRQSDVLDCQYNASYNSDVYRFAGTLIYDGKVYDHVHFRIRGQYSTYITGKNKWKYRFNRGHWFQGRDDYGKKRAEKVKTLNIDSLNSPWASQNRGLAGLDESIGFKLFNMAGVPGCNTNVFQYRIIDSSVEADPGNQYEGDLWGLYLAVEQPDARFLAEHGLPDGNLYKMQGASSRSLSQSATQVTDLSDLYSFRSSGFGYNKTNPIQTMTWWNSNVNQNGYYSYRSVVEAVNHSDLREQENCLYYHHPLTGQWWVLPWDLDLLYEEFDRWGPNGIQSSAELEQFRKVLEHEEANIAFQGRGRELQDLLLNSEQLWQVIDEYVSILSPPESSLSWADIDRAMWDYNPRTTTRFGSYPGGFYKTPYPGDHIYPGFSGYQRILPSADCAGMIQYVKNFTTAGGFGGDRLTALVADSDIPSTPTVVYTGVAGFPENGLTFECSAFSDPQGAGTFAAMKWRIAEVEPSSVPSTSPSGGTVALIGAEDEWKYFKGTQEPSSPVTKWRQLSFNDNGWLAGVTPIGYGPVVTTELTDMRNGYTTVYLRKEFQINNPTDIETLRFSINYDEGFNLWINGTHLDSVNVSGAEVPYTATAPNYISGQTSTELTYSNPDSFLVSGTNIIAIQLLNNTIGSSDILFDPVLEADLVANPGSPGGYDYVYTGKPGKYEIDAVWESPEITTFSNTIRIPADGVKAGRTYRVRCRMKDDTGRWSHWSDPNQFVAGEAINADILDYLRVSEVMYNNGDADFIELKNIGTIILDLSDVSMTDGVIFSFAGSNVTTLAPGKFVLVVKDQAAFEAQYGTGLNSKIAGTFVDSSLSNSGETVKVEDYWNGTIEEFEYNDGRGWPIAADGAGHSLIPLELAMEDQPLGTLDYGGNWRQSSHIGGSPGEDDPTLEASVVINEFMAHTDYPHPPHESNDWIELYNAGASTVNLNSNWYLSDDSDNLKKYALPTSALFSGGFVSYDQVNHFNPDGTGPSGWGLNKAGDTLFLSYLPGTSEDHVVDCIKFKGQENGISLSRYPNGESYWFSTSPHTRDGANNHPVNRVVISEIMYHPQEDTATEIYDEYVELYNPTGSPVNLWTATGPWVLDGDADYTFPASTTLNTGDRIIIVDFDPADSIRRVAFESAYNTGPLTAGVDIFGPWSGNLSNNGGRITLEKPQDSDDPENPQDISWIIVDECIYNDYWPWPVDSDGTGPNNGPDGTGDALCRISPVAAASGNDPGNWHAASPSPAE